MNELIKKIQEFKKTEIKNQIDKRILEFKNTNKKSNEQLFNELCFCILTANCAAKTCIKIQNSIKSGFLEYSENELRKKLKDYSYRFPNIRTIYIVEARKMFLEIYQNIHEGHVLLFIIYENRIFSLSL